MRSAKSKSKGLQENPGTMVHVCLELKPFSANNMHYAMKRTDTAEYKRFKREIKELLGGDYRVPKEAQYKLTLVSGFTNKASDLDNTFKPLLDAMQGAMGFDDKQIYAIEAYKDVRTKVQGPYLMIKLKRVYPSWVQRKIKKLLGEVPDVLG